MHSGAVTLTPTGIEAPLSIAGSAPTSMSVCVTMWPEGCCTSMTLSFSAATAS